MGYGNLLETYWKLNEKLKLKIRRKTNGSKVDKSKR